MDVDPSGPGGAGDPSDAADTESRGPEGADRVKRELDPNGRFSYALGSWICPECTYAVNPPGETRCSCGASFYEATAWAPYDSNEERRKREARASQKAAQQTALDAALASSGWECIRCAGRNLTWRRVCFRRSHPRPSRREDGAAESSESLDRDARRARIEEAISTLGVRSKEGGVRRTRGGKKHKASRRRKLARARLVVPPRGSSERGAPTAVGSDGSEPESDGSSWPPLLGEELAMDDVRDEAGQPEQNMEEGPGVQDGAGQPDRRPGRSRP